MSEVVVEEIGRTRVVTINRPEARNALTRGVLAALTAAFDDANADSNVRCVVLTGRGGHFCAGADLKKQLMDDPNLLDQLETYLDEYHGVIRSLVRCTKPTLAMVDGAAVGFGADLAFACDLRVVSTTAYVQEKFVKIGLMPDGGGTFWLPRLVGTAKAMSMILLAEKVEAEEMRALGIALRVAEPSALRDVTLTVARELEAGPPLAFAAAKAAVQASSGDIEAALRREREGQIKLLRSQDCLSGIMAWAQKREPVFEGR